MKREPNLNYCEMPTGLAYAVLKGDLADCPSRRHFEKICQHWVWARRRGKQRVKSMRDKSTEFGMTRREIILGYLKNARYSLESHAEYWEVDIRKYDIGGLSLGRRR